MRTLYVAVEATPNRIDPRLELAHHRRHARPSEGIPPSTRTNVLTEQSETWKSGFIPENEEVMFPCTVAVSFIGVPFC